MQKISAAVLLSLALLFGSATAVAAQTETTLPDNPVTDDTSDDSDNFDDWGLLGLLGLLGLAGLAGRKRRDVDTVRTSDRGATSAR